MATHSKMKGRRAASGPQQALLKQTAAGIKVTAESSLKNPITKELILVDEFDSNKKPKILKTTKKFQYHAIKR